MGPVTVAWLNKVNGAVKTVREPGHDDPACQEYKLDSCEFDPLRSIVGFNGR